MNETDLMEKNINDLYEKLSKDDDKIKKISHRCNREEITNV
jgi:hypothetical protein